jgi:hypothetical protein
MVLHYIEKDAEYEQWRKDHPDGYVLNVFNSSNPIKIHRTNCPTLKMDKGKRTSLKKYCSIHYADLEEIARTIREWARCKRCL